MIVFVMNVYNSHMPRAAFLWTPKPKEDRRNASTQQRQYLNNHYRENDRDKGSHKSHKRRSAEQRIVSQEHYPGHTVSYHHGLVYNIYIYVGP